jgi:hypothetical protein
MWLILPQPCEGDENKNLHGSIKDRQILDCLSDCFFKSGFVPWD